MAFPEYVPTRAVSIGGAAILESGESLSIRVRYTSSKSLVWNATGFRFEKYGREVKSELGSEIVISLPRTDVQGWRDPELNAIIDVSAEGSYTHKYTAEVEYVDERGRVVGRIPRVGPFTVPAGDGVLDLDTYVPASSVAGEFVSIPDSWGRDVAAAKAAAVDAARSASEVGEAIPAAVTAAITEDGPAKEALANAIGAVVGGAVDEALAGISPEPGTVWNVTTAPDGCLILIATPAPLPATPDAPADLTADASIGGVTLSWSTAATPGQAPIEDYRVQYKPVASSSWVTAPRTPSTVTSHTVAGLANGADYEARVAGVSIAGVGAYSAPVSFRPGAVDGIVMQDLFDRTVAELVGTSPTTGGGAWTGTAGNFTVSGGRAVSTGNAQLTRVNTGAKGIAGRGVTAVVRFAADETVSKSMRIYTHWIDSTHYLYIALNCSAAGVASVAVLGAFGAGSVTLPNQFPAGVIATGSAAADINVSAVLAGTSFVVAVNGVERTYALTNEQLAQIVNATEVAIYSNSAQHQFDTLTATVSGTYV